MKYHKGQCEICVYSKPKPLDRVTFLCFADTSRKYGGEVSFVTKKVLAKRRCRYFERLEK